MISIDRPISLLLPFQAVKLRLSHRLLDSLGGVSRFILAALADGLSLSQLVEVTGLSATALSGQLTFLKQFDFVSAEEQGELTTFSLSERGERMLRIDRLLAGFSPEVWIDSFTIDRKYMYLALPHGNDDVFIRDLTSHNFSDHCLLQMPTRSRNYRHFDQLSRLRNLFGNDGLCDLLKHYWPGEHDLIDTEGDYWLCTLSPDDENLKSGVLHLAFRPKELIFLPPASPERSPRGYQGLPWVIFPTLQLTYTFRRAKNFPLAVSIPETYHKTYERMSYSLLPSFVTCQDDRFEQFAQFTPRKEYAGEDTIPGIHIPAGVEMSLEITEPIALYGLEHTILASKLGEHQNIKFLSLLPSLPRSAT